MVCDRVSHAVDRLKRLLYPRLAVRAHHSFYLDSFCHRFFLLFCFSGNDFFKRFRVDGFTFFVARGAVRLHQIQAQRVHAHKEA